MATLPDAYFLRKGALALTHPRSLDRALARVENLAAIHRLSERLGGAGGEAGWGVSAETPIYPVEHHLAHVGCSSCCRWEETMFESSYEQLPMTPWEKHGRSRRSSLGLPPSNKKTYGGGAQPTPGGTAPVKTACSTRASSGRMRRS